MMHPNNSGSAVRIFLQFCTWKGPKRDMEINGVFKKISYSRQHCHFGAKLVRNRNFFIWLEISFDFAQ